jgi:hypothetical protein
MRLEDVKFKKRFCVNYFRNLRLPMGEMSLHNDWLNTNNRGDAYPLIEKSDEACECVAHEKYTVSFGSCGLVKRMLFSYFPWCSYDVDFESLAKEIGFALISPNGNAEITFNKKGLVKVKTPSGTEEKNCEPMARGTISVAFRGRGVSVYSVIDGEHTLLFDVADAFFESLTKESVLIDTKICLLVSGDETFDGAVLQCVILHDGHDGCYTQSVIGTQCGTTCAHPISIYVAVDGIFLKVMCTLGCLLWHHIHVGLQYDTLAVFQTGGGGFAHNDVACFVHEGFYANLLAEVEQEFLYWFKVT